MYDEAHIYYITDTNRRHVFNELWNNAPVGWRIQIEPPKRSLDQNSKLWPMLDDIRRQVEWHGMWLSRDEWKDMFTAALKRLKVVPAIDGNGFVVVGGRTSKMSKREFSDLIELIYAFGSEKNVVWSEKAKQMRAELMGRAVLGQS